MDRTETDILIIGAGMAGLACATRLAEAGHAVTVLDKGRGPGGRMAARRVEIAGEVISFDHGAQYFTARDDGFLNALGTWRELGVVARWPAAGSEAWVGTPGMNGPIRAMAQDLNVHWSTRVERLSREDAGWIATTQDSELTAETVLVAVPAEQARDMLADAVPDLAAVPARVQSEPCWAVMAAFAQRLELEQDTIRDPDAAVSWAARNSAKPDRNGYECWVLHASPARSRELMDLPKEQVATLLLDDFFNQTGCECVAPVHLAAHRWLYAMPSAITGKPARYDAEARIGIAGDYLHSPRVEGAWISGHALAGMVLASP